MEERPVLLIPEIYEENYSPEQDVFTLIYDLPQSTRDIKWNGSMLALAHEDGVSVLTPIPKTSKLAMNLPSSLQQEWCWQLNKIITKNGVVKMRFTSKYLLLGLEDGELVIINHLDGSQLQLERTRGDINSLDVNDSGVCCMSDDSGQVTLWEHGQVIRSLSLQATLVKFWMGKDTDKLLIADGKTVKVYDWRKDELLYTIYPLPYTANGEDFIKDVMIVNENIVVIGDGWWKEYGTLTGGAGYTFPSSEGVLNGWLNGTKYISSSTVALIGGISQNRSCFYDFTTGSNQAAQIKLSLPSVSISCGAINHLGVVAFASGSKLILTKPFDSYEAIQY